MTAHEAERLIAAARSYAAEGVAAGAIDTAVAAIRALPAWVPQPGMHPDPEGDDPSVAMLWFHDGDRVDAYFYADGGMVWVGKIAGEHVGDNVPCGGGVPPGFVMTLRRLFRRAEAP